jgi:hypothetical protein
LLDEDSEMTMRAYGWAAALALLLMPGGRAWSGADAGLIFTPVKEARSAELRLENGKAQALPAGAKVLLVRRADPESIQSGEWVSFQQEGDGAPLWLLVGEGEVPVRRLVQAAEVKSPAAKRVGGIGTCTLYTPCPKCRQWAEETRAKRKVHPPALRVAEIAPSAIRAGQLVVPTTCGNLLLIQDAAAGEALNEVRRLAVRARLLER